MTLMQRMSQLEEAAAFHKSVSPDGTVPGILDQAQPAGARSAFAICQDASRASYPECC